MTLALALLAAALALVAVILAVRLARARRELARLTRGLEKTEAQLEAARSARLDIIDAVAHELRTPLSAILGHQELLAEGLYGALTERSRSAVARIGDSSKQLLHLIDGVLDLARVELRALELQLEPTNSRALVEEAVRYAQSLTGERGAGLELDVAEHLPTLTTDARRAERLLHLAVTAAVRATGAQPLSVRASRDEQGDALLFEVGGTALDPDPPAERASDTPRDPEGEAVRELRRALPPSVGGGSGDAPGPSKGPGETRHPGRSWLRLTVARTLARRLGGELRVREEGETSRLTVRLTSLSD